MNIFNGNDKLEELVFEAIDRGLFIRSDQDTPIMPFLLTQKNGESSVIVLEDADPDTVIRDLFEDPEACPDQLVLCVEVTLRDPEHPDEKQDAILVKAFDSSEPQGLVFAQKFRGIESGLPFVPIGNPALLQHDGEPLPITPIPRDTYKSTEALFHSALRDTGKDDLFNRTIIIGHPRASRLARAIKQDVLSTLDEGDPDFSGMFEFQIVPGTLELDESKAFPLRIAQYVLSQHQLVRAWEQQMNRPVQVTVLHERSHLIPRWDGGADAIPDAIPQATPPPPKKKWWQFWK